MKNFKRQLAGHKAKLTGQNFENEFKITCIKQGISCHQLPPFGSVFTHKQNNPKLKIICDFIIGYKKNIMLIDTKSISENSLSYSTVNKKSFSYQVKTLSKFQSNLLAQRSGFIIKYKVGVIAMHCPLQLYRIAPKTSVGYKDALIYWDKDKVDLRQIFEIDFKPPRT